MAGEETVLKILLSDEAPPATAGAPAAQPVEARPVKPEPVAAKTPGERRKDLRPNADLDAVFGIEPEAEPEGEKTVEAEPGAGKVEEEELVGAKPVGGKPETEELVGARDLVETVLRESRDLLVRLFAAVPVEAVAAGIGGQAGGGPAEPDTEEEEPEEFAAPASRPRRPRRQKPVEAEPGETFGPPVDDKTLAIIEAARRRDREAFNKQVEAVFDAMTGKVYDAEPVDPFDIANQRARGRRDKDLQKKRDEAAYQNLTEGPDESLIPEALPADEKQHGSLKDILGSLFGANAGKLGGAADAVGKAVGGEAFGASLAGLAEAVTPVAAIMGGLYAAENLFKGAVTSATDAVAALGHAGAQAAAGHNGEAVFSLIDGLGHKVEEVSGSFLTFNPVLYAASKTFNVVIEAGKALTQAFTARADELAQYSGAISLAQANAQVRQIGADFHEANALGGDLARFLDAKSQLEVDFQKALEPLKQVLVEKVATVLQNVDTAVVAATPLIESFGKALPGLFDMATGVSQLIPGVGQVMMALNILTKKWGAALAAQELERLAKESSLMDALRKTLFSDMPRLNQRDDPVMADFENRGRINPAGFNF